MLKLDKRLQAIVNEIHGECLADIGCDHGKVTIACLQKQKVKSAIASDISSASLQKTAELAKHYAVNNVKCRCCNGFEGYKDYEADVCVVAGMGAQEIIRIIKNAPKGLKRFVLVPHRGDEQLRRYISQNKMQIISDYVVYCKQHFYHIIVAEPGEKCLSESEILLGNSPRSNKDFANYLINLKRKKQFILSNSNDENIKQECESYLQSIHTQMQKREECHDKN